MGEGNYPVCQSPVFPGFSGRVASSRTGLAYNLAGPTLGDFELLLYVHHSFSPPGRAQTFFRLTSFRMDISTACSATIFFRRAFSSSNSRKRFTSLAFIPPYRLRQRWKVAR